ncbi:MAG: hypothetical protein K9W46_12245 [Candidatus Heimdallarchaeum endolithica]|uniref:Uncharacterized protein n=1 Tax=Candidatus Heimdallarchaeum endolithica TaxID=2876572 RepID=A0A9Y1BQK4_9ARCH|nr:MAG: hypothetical protein K9W46_12245 [Candidatus Heimdallarchaeum endolithica]
MFICDSTFLIAFYIELDNRLDILLKVKNKDKKVVYFITPLIFSEVSAKSPDLFQDNPSLFPVFPQKQGKEIENEYLPFLEPFVGKGEREVILYSISYGKTPILDDKFAVKVWLKISGKKPMRTSRFIVETYCSWDIISKSEAIHLLKKLKEKGFRISDDILLSLIRTIDTCKK